MTRLHNSFQFRFFYLETDYKNNWPLNDRRWLFNVLTHYSKSLAFDVNYIFCNRFKMIEVNRQFLNHDYDTDVIGFQLEEGIIGGDIYVGVDFIKKSAVIYNQPFELEVRRVMVHGLLHFLGFKDKTTPQKKEMRQEEDLCLALHPLL